MSPNRHDVTKRHPEFPTEMDVHEPITLLDVLPLEPEDGVLSLDMPCDPTADTRCYPLDLFNREVTPLEYSAGTTLTSYKRWTLAQSVGVDDDDGTSVPGDITLTQITGIWWKKPVSSYVGTGYDPHTARQSWSPCTGLDNTFHGWYRSEQWWSFTIGAHPADAAGVVFGPITFVSPTGIAGGRVGQMAGAYVVAQSSAPTGFGQGAVLAHISHEEATSIFVPASLVPADGGTLWLGVQPAWTADFGNYTCGFTWPWMNGQGNSGTGYTNGSWVLTWQTWDSTELDWGSPLDGDDVDAWWDTPSPWVVTSSGGTAGITGDALYLTAPSGSQSTLSAYLEGSSTYSPSDDDDTSYGEPWSADGGVRMKARFKVTTAGVATDGGLRYLQFEWHDGRQLNRVRVNLGDSVAGEGLTISNGEVEASVEKAITEGSFMWVSLDTRNPYYLRAKLWAEGASLGSGEPAYWDVVLEQSDDTESPTRNDYFQVSISAGNATGADQTVQVYGIWFCGAGDDCEWVEEKIGEGDGTTTLYGTSQPWKDGLLWFFVDGMHVRVEPESLPGGTFRSVDGLAAANHANLVARYRVDLNPDGD